MFFPYSVDSQQQHRYRQEQPWLVYGLLIAYALIHAALASRPEALQEILLTQFGIVPMDFQPLTIVSSTFLHAGWLHLLGNGYFLFVYGSSLERLVGSLGFLLIVIVGTFASGMLHLVTADSLHADMPCVGASGVVAAVLGAFLVMMPMANLRCMFFSPLSFRPISVDAKAWIILLLWFCGQLLFSLKVVFASGDVAFWAHIGGFVAGAGLGTLYMKLRKQHDQDVLIAHKRGSLPNAWEAYLEGDVEGATELLEGNANRGSGKFLDGLVSSEGDPDLTWRVLFEQAREMKSKSRMVSVYLAMLSRFEPADVNPAIHAEAGFAALDIESYRTAALAFYLAIACGSHDRGRILGAMGRVCINGYNDFDLAERFKALQLQQVGSV